jgi:hypothetical protein
LRLTPAIDAEIKRIEAEIRRIDVQASLGKKLGRPPSQLNKNKN